MCCGAVQFGPSGRGHRLNRELGSENHLAGLPPLFFARTLQRRVQSCRCVQATTLVFRASPDCGPSESIIGKPIEVVFSRRRSRARGLLFHRLPQQAAAIGLGPYQIIISSP